MADKNDAEWVSPKHLDSWKEIAHYLGVNVRTVQKWEREKGLPVKRLPGSRGRVSADPAELEHWRKTTLKKPPWFARLKFLKYYAVFATALLLVAAGVILGNYIAANRRGSPAVFRLDSSTLVVMDAAGRELWRKIFPGPFFPERYVERMLATHPATWFGDLDETADIETLFVYYPATREKTGTALICFSEKGEEKWRFIPGKAVSDGTETYSPFYVLANFLVALLKKDGEKRVLVTSHHLSYHPNQFAVLDETGAVLSEYWHSGHLEHLDVGDLDNDGAAEIFLAGVNNGYRAAALVVLDSANISGTSWQGEENRLQLHGFEKGKEKAMVLFPRTCINKKFENFNKVRLLAVAAGSIKVNVAEKENDPACEVIYALDRNLKVTSVEFSDRLKNLHRELESKGEIDHVLSAEEIERMKAIRDSQTNVVKTKMDG